MAGYARSTCAVRKLLLQFLFVLIYVLQRKVHQTIDQIQNYIQLFIRQVVKLLKIIDGPVNLRLFFVRIDWRIIFRDQVIQLELEKKRDSIPCVSCPYHPSRTGPDTTSCPDPREHMAVPNHRKTINRLLKHIPPQMILYARKGYREWRAEYGLFVIRERPLLVNESWQGDHHKFDLFVRITIRKESNGKSYEKEIAVRPTLTAWMDSATGCIVGWVISVMPKETLI